MAWETLYSEEQLKENVAEVAKALDRSLIAVTDRLPFVVGIARGGLPLANLFTETLLRNGTPYLRSDVSVSSYRGQIRSDVLLREPNIFSYTKDFRAFAFVLVDDICDSGHTLRVLHDYLAQRYDSPIYSLVAVTREHADRVYTPSHSLFSFRGPDFLAGFGMDDGSGDPRQEQAARDLKHIVIKRD